MNLQYRLAKKADEGKIWIILQEAILIRKIAGSKQWQDGYPNPETISNDIQNSYGYVWEQDGKVIAYAAIIFNKEPAYELLNNWLSQKYAVIHRVAVSSHFLNMGIATTVFKDIEQIALDKQVNSIRVDTNFDNHPMLRVFEKLNYSYRGEVYFRGSPRKAYEKTLEVA